MFGMGRLGVVMSLTNYEKLLSWTAHVCVFLADHSSPSGESAVLAQKLNALVTALGSQSPLWQQASARLSQTPSDFAQFEIQRAMDRIRIPTLCQEVYTEVVEYKGECPVPQENPIFFPE
jgi:hypothetical protein